MKTYAIINIDHYNKCLCEVEEDKIANMIFKNKYYYIKKIIEAQFEETEYRADETFYTDIRHGRCTKCVPDNALILENVEYETALEKFNEK